MCAGSRGGVLGWPFLRRRDVKHGFVGGISYGRGAYIAKGGIFPLL